MKILTTTALTVRKFAIQVEHLIRFANTAGFDWMRCWLRCYGCFFLSFFHANFICMCWVWKFRCTLICTIYECVRLAVGLCLCAVYVLYSELHSSVVVISHQHQYKCRAVAMDFKNYDMWLVLSELLCRSHIHCHVSVGIIWIQSQIERNGLRLVQSWTNAHISFTHFAKNIVLV